MVESLLNEQETFNICLLPSLFSASILKRSVSSSNSFRYCKFFLHILYPNKKLVIFRFYRFCLSLKKRPLSGYEKAPRFSYARPRVKTGPLFNWRAAFETSGIILKVALCEYAQTRYPRASRHRTPLVSGGGGGGAIQGPCSNLALQNIPGDLDFYSRL